ncbi:serine hydrolase domain-containing protein [Paractinoplanes rishiriensis]|uniref:Beta-lactamase-related domain-containing protein n=1 Tax=Paractinoplanes rishiriensis TaxID=1050105 RepID=A0A919JYP3_9ACTN|nr:serine hydrolase [Actinoplanes rishiriensis]GIE95508.1 hypothetical protein Ari01nite_29730 [Actinoplanes rishiriensis]
MSLPRSTPAEQGVDATGITAFVDALAGTPEVELHSLMVLRHGHVVAEQWWRPYAPDRPHLLYSLSKSFASTALGFAVAEGLVDLDATVLSYFPRFDKKIKDPKSRSIRVRDVAAMASGHTGETIDEAFAAGRGDPLLGFLRLPPEHEPGSVFAYNQPCTHALSAIIQQVTGDTLTAFLRTRLFQPLGIERYGWSPDRQGRDLGFTGLFTTTEAVAKLGQLYLDEGRWQGRKLLPAEWVAEATRAHVATAGDDPDWRAGYGFQFWRNREGYRGDGAFGQLMVVLPEADAVVAITSQSHDIPAVMDALFDHLRPALTAGSGPAGAWPVGSPELPRPAGPGRAIPTMSYRPAPDHAVGSLRKIRTRPGRLSVDRLTAPLGEPGGWTGDGPHATAYAWDGDTLRIDLIFVETPHRLHLALDPAAGTFAARWQTEPLGRDPFDRLRMPQG